MKVYREDEKTLQGRIDVLFWAVVAAFIVLASSFWYVQVVQAEKYRDLSDANALRDVTVRAQRGLILDRKGRVLAENQPSHTLVLMRNELSQSTRRDETHLPRLVRFVSTVLGLNEAEVTRRIEKGRATPVNLPLTIAEDLSIPQVASIEAGKLTFPALSVESTASRNYPNATIAAHVLGYMGEASAEELKRRPELRMGDLVGRRGVELVYDTELRGKDGAKFIVVDSHGRVKEEYDKLSREPQRGQNIYLTIDLDLQRKAEQYFMENEMVGSCVVLDPRNGEVLALVSSPAYDPNIYSKRFTSTVWKTILSNPFRIEVNRAIQGLYSPGSVFKIVMGMAGLELGVIDESTQFHCAGSESFYGRRFRCWNKNGHGSVNLEEAIKVSCDVFFYNLGAKLGVNRIADYSHLLTFGEQTTIDLEGEKPGLVPSESWARDKQKRKWYPSETISVAIGQGPLLVTPLQVANMMAAIANGGSVYQPHVLHQRQVNDAAGKPQTLTVAPRLLHKIHLDPQALSAVRTGLWRVVNEAGGTGAKARVEGIDVAGKTGTVQVVAQEGWVRADDLPFKFRDHAWFASYAPKENAELVVVIFVEHGGHGGSDAAPLARILYETVFADRLHGGGGRITSPQARATAPQPVGPPPGTAR
ncbi:MAG: penicillin-binding protein 2 [Thermoanaerobaculia bacterium]|jgi:penicillin-binding protein 2